MGVRITPTGPSASELVDISEARAAFNQIDTDANLLAEGDGKSYFYEWVENYLEQPPLQHERGRQGDFGDKLPSDWNIVGYGNCQAWEEDFKRTEYGGTNNIYADEHDPVFFSGHGSKNNGEYYSDSTRSTVLQ